MITGDVADRVAIGAVLARMEQKGGLRCHATSRAISVSAMERLLLIRPFRRLLPVFGLTPRPIPLRRHKSNSDAAL